MAPPVTPLNSVGQSSQVSTTGRPDQHFLISHHHHLTPPSSHSHNYLNFADNKSSMSARPITDIFLTVAGSGGEGRRERRGSSQTAGAEELELTTDRGRLAGLRGTDWTGTPSLLSPPATVAPKLPTRAKTTFAQTALSLSDLLPRTLTGRGKGTGRHPTQDHEDTTLCDCSPSHYYTSQS